MGLLAEYAGDAKLLAGGQSLVPLMNFRLARPAVIIDINGVEGLDEIRVDDATGELVIGALVRQSDAEGSPLVGDRCPLLAAALQHVGHRTIRNRGTVGGSLAHADPAAELPLVLMTLGGRVRLTSVSGERWVMADKFFISYLTTALAADELLVEARFPPPAAGPGVGWGFQEFSRRHGDFALAGAAVALRLEAGRVERCVIGIAGCGPIPKRAADSERRLVNHAPDDEATREAAALAAGSCDADSDLHASGDYRRALVAAMVRRALVEARGRALAVRP